MDRRNWSDKIEACVRKKNQISIPDELQTKPETARVGTPEDETSGASTQKTEENNDSEPKLATVIRIVFEVRDADGGATKGVLQLNLAKGTEVPE